METARWITTAICFVTLASFACTILLLQAEVGTTQPESREERISQRGVVWARRATLLPSGQFSSVLQSVLCFLVGESTGCCQVGNLHWGWAIGETEERNCKTLGLVVCNNFLLGWRVQCCFVVCCAYSRLPLCTCLVWRDLQLSSNRFWERFRGRRGGVRARRGWGGASEGDVITFCSVC